MLNILVKSIFISLFVSISVADALDGVTVLDTTALTGRIAFTYYPDSKSKDGDIYLLDLRKRIISPLIVRAGIDEYPVFAPDGQSLLFVKNDNGNSEIFLLNLKNKEITQLTNHPAIDEDPDWSADGKRFVFSSGRSGPGQNIFISDLSGKVIQQLTTNRFRNTVPKWSHGSNSDEIIFSTDEFWPGWELAVYNLKEKKVTRLTNGINSYCRAAWDSNGDRFAFSYGSGTDVDLWLQNKGEEEPSQITSHPGREYDATWGASTDEYNSQPIFYSGELTPGKNDFQLFLINISNSMPSEVNKDMAARQILAVNGRVRHLSYTKFEN
jgi:Tol biopolymer transport system component